MRPMAPASDRGVMPTSTASPGRWPARVIIIDDHEISRAAFIALLRAEGIDVTAGLRTSDQVITAARAPPGRGDHRRDASGRYRVRHRRSAPRPARSAHRHPHLQHRPCPLRHPAHRPPFHRQGRHLRGRDRQPGNSFQTRPTGIAESLTPARRATSQKDERPASAQTRNLLADLSDWRTQTTRALHS